MKKLLTIILFPHAAVLALLAFLSACLLILAFAVNGIGLPFQIGAYMLSFYALVILCLRTPDIMRKISIYKRENRHYLRYTRDMRFRMNLTLGCALMANAAYGVFQLCLGFWHRSAWFFSMAGYYFLLAGMRIMLFKYSKANAPGEKPNIEWRKYRLCGVCLLFMNLALSVFMLYFVYRIRVFHHHEITTIAMAAYTFTALTFACVNFAKSSRMNSPVYAACKAGALAAAAVSRLTLENALMTTFDRGHGEAFHRIMLGATGVCVMASVFLIAIVLIVRGTREIKNQTGE